MRSGAGSPPNAGEVRQILAAGVWGAPLDVGWRLDTTKSAQIQAGPRTISVPSSASFAQMLAQDSTGVYLADKVGGTPAGRPRAR